MIQGAKHEATLRGRALGQEVLRLDANPLFSTFVLVLATTPLVLVLAMLSDGLSRVMEDMHETRRTARYFGMLAFVACLASIPAILFWFRRRHASDGVTLYEHGMTLRHGSRVRSCRYDDVTTIFRGELAGRNIGPEGLAYVRVRLSDGSVLDTKCLNMRIGPAMTAATTAVEEQVYARLLLPMLERFERGEEIDFGPVRASTRGLKVGRQEELPWEEVGEFGRVTLAINGIGMTDLTLDSARNGKRIGSWPTIRIGNLLGLLVIADRMRERAARGGAVPAGTG